MMMGYGGSSPSSSNLSALAPPFTVDRSIPKPVVDLTDTAYGIAYNHSSHDWLGPQPPTPSPDHFSSTNMKEFESAAPSSNGYRFSFVDTALYPQNSKNLVEVKSYYPSYYSNAIGSCSLSEIPHSCGHDLLSSSLAPTTNLSVHEYSSSHWSGSWEGLTEWQHARPAQFDESLYSKENYFNQGQYTSEGMINFEEASHKNDVAVTEKETESGFRGQRDHESLLGEIPKFVSSVCPIYTSSVSTPQVPETCTPLESLKPVNPWSHQMPYGASYEKWLRKHDATPSDIPSVINSSPVDFIGPLEHDTSSFRNRNSTGDADNRALPSNTPCAVMEPYSSTLAKLSFSGNSSSFFLEPDPSMSSKSSVRYDGQASFSYENNEQFISGFPLGKSKQPSRYETVPIDTLDQLYGKKARILVPPATPDSSSIICGKSDRVKNYSDNVDQNNPAVDSPCWRGAPVSHFSKFPVSEACGPHSIKKVEALSGPDLQAHPISDLGGNDAENISREKTNKNLKRQESWSKGSCFAPPLNTIAVDNLELREGITDDSLRRNELYDSNNKILHSEKQNFEARISVTNVGMNVNDDFDDFSSQVPFQAIQNVLNSPPSTGDAPSNFIESNGGESTQKMHIRTLIDTMQNLSELLVFHLSSRACELKKDDCDAVKDVIHNLHLCMNKTVERSEKACTSHVHGSSSNNDKDPIENKSQASGIHPPNIQASVKYQLVREEDHSSVSGKSDEKLSNLVSGDKLKDYIMIQALKKALVANFDADEVTDPRVLLYKNLWLEAEASLCSASCISRFNRMKNEMENFNSQITHGKSFNDAANTFSSDAKGSSNEDDIAARFNILKSRIDNSSTENTSYEDLLGYVSGKSLNPDAADSTFSSGANASSNEDDIAARFNVLKCRVDKTYETEGYAEPKNSEKSVVQKSLLPTSDDFEDSVMSRFCILKCRDDHLTQTMPETPENLTQVKESHHEDRIVDRSRANLGDWEHVLLEELTGLGSSS